MRVLEIISETLNVDIVNVFRKKNTLNKVLISGTKIRYLTALYKKCGQIVF